MCVPTLLSDDYENTALFPPPANFDSGLLLGSVDPPWQPLGEQDRHTSSVVPLCGQAFSSSSSSHSSVSEQAATLIQRRKHSYRRPSGELVSAHGRAETNTVGTRTLEFFSDRPAEPTFSQERNNLHAKEVSVLMGGMTSTDRLGLDLSTQQTCSSTCFSLRVKGRIIFNQC